MIDHESIHKRAEAYHQDNTKKVLELLERDFDLHNLDSVFYTDLAEIYRKVLPRYAKLCEINGSRPLDDTERAELAVHYASLYATFGDDGTTTLAAMWLATKPYRQARGS